MTELAQLKNRVAAAERSVHKMIQALKPFAAGADQIPDSWPDARALLIDEKHADNPKGHCLLLARVEDFRRARDVLRPRADQQSQNRSE